MSSDNSDDELIEDPPALKNTVQNKHIQNLKSNDTTKSTGNIKNAKAVHSSTNNISMKDKTGTQSVTRLKPPLPNNRAASKTLVPQLPPKQTKPSPPSANEPSEYKRIKILSIGDSTVGKSCLIKRYCESKFMEEYVSTIGIDYGVKSFKTHLEDVKVNFWDTAGDDVYFDIRNEFYKDTHGVILVYDISDISTYASLKRWIEEFKQYCTTDVILYVLGNKSDLEEKREVTFEQGEQMADMCKARFFEVSALNGTNVDDMFSELFYETLTSIFPEYSMANK
ncbi:P-loop containing nucleoside triphosphate hydrolase protein [Globomyces pollinis-pini]|nr:P-loop containing nucleoside triphosphate hydrolase protein [Globomyces pollinis-pini]